MLFIYFNYASFVLIFFSNLITDSSLPLHIIPLPNYPESLLYVTVSWNNSNNLFF